MEKQDYQDKLSNDDAHIPQMITQRVDNLVVEELEQFVASVDEIDFDTKPAKHRSVFASDHTGSVDRDRLRRMVQR